MWCGVLCGKGLFTLGGFGIGWLRDSYRMPEYVAAANNEQKWSERLASRMSRHEKPSQYAALSIAQYIVGMYGSALAVALVWWIESIMYVCGGIGYRTATVQRMSDEGVMENVKEDVLIPVIATGTVTTHAPETASDHLRRSMLTRDVCL